MPLPTLCKNEGAHHDEVSVAEPAGAASSAAGQKIEAQLAAAAPEALPDPERHPHRGAHRSRRRRKDGAGYVIAR